MKIMNNKKLENFNNLDFSLRIVNKGPELCL